VVPDIHCDQRQSMILQKDHIQTIREPVFLTIELYDGSAGSHKFS
jgi:hypothetical protein